MNRFGALEIESDEEDIPKVHFRQQTAKLQSQSLPQDPSQSLPQGPSQSLSQGDSLRSRMMSKTDGQREVRKQEGRPEGRPNQRPKREVQQQVPSDSDFPCLSTRVKSTTNNVSGTWVKGSEPIRKAKDLPDPVKLRRQLEQEACRARLAAACEEEDVLEDQNEDQLSDCEEGVSNWDF